LRKLTEAKERSRITSNIYIVMAGLVPAIHDFLAHRKKDVDARHKAGHDAERMRLAPRNDVE
jgi:hypothetical protein